MSQSLYEVLVTGLAQNEGPLLIRCSVFIQNAVDKEIIGELIGRVEFQSLTSEFRLSSSGWAELGILQQQTATLDLSGVG